MTRAMQRRIAGLAAVAVAGASLWWVSRSDLEDAMVYYLTPTELIASAHAQTSTFRLGGMVKAGSLEWDREAQHASFTLTDGVEDIRIKCTGNPPQLFREGIGAVVEGRLGTDGVFETDRVMVKHSNEYSAPEGHPPQAGQPPHPIDE